MSQEILRRSFITLPLPASPGIAAAVATFIAGRPLRILKAQLCLSDRGTGAVTSAVTVPTPAASTTGAGSTATFTLGADANTLAGTLAVAVGSGSAAVTVPTPAASTTGAGSTATFTLADSNYLLAGTLAIQVGSGSAAVTIPTPVASTLIAGSTATFTLTDSNFTLAGTLAVAVGGGAAIDSTFAAGTTIAAAVTQLNGQSSFSTASLVASQGTGANAKKIIITGPVDATVPGTNTLVLTGTALTQATVGGGGAIDSVFAAGTTIAAAVVQLNGQSSFTAAGLSAAQGTAGNANKIIVTGPLDLLTASSHTLVLAGTALTQVTVGGGGAIDSVFVAGTSIAAAVGQLNRQTSFNSAGLVAAQGTAGDTNKIIITGPSDAISAGTHTLVLTGTAMTQTTVGGGPTTVVLNQNGTALLTDHPLSVAQAATVNATEVKLLGTVQNYPGGQRIDCGDVLTVDVTSVPSSTAPVAASVILLIAEQDI